MTERMLSPASRVVGSFGVGMRKTPRSTKFIDTSRVGLHNAFVPLARRLFDRNRVARILERDRAMCQSLPGYRAVISVIVKDRAAWNEAPLHEVTADRILDFAVPLHYPRTC